MTIHSNVASLRTVRALRADQRSPLLVSGCLLALAEATEAYLPKAVRIGADREEARRALAARMATMPIHLSFDKAFADVFPGLPH